MWRIFVFPVTVTDGKALKILPDAGYALSREAVDFDHGELIDSKLFGEEQEWLLLNSAGFSGSHIATEAQNANPRIEVKTKIEPLRQEIQNLYKLAESVRESINEHSWSETYIFFAFLLYIILTKTYISVLQVKTLKLNLFR